MMGISKWKDMCDWDKNRAYGIGINNVMSHAHKLQQEHGHKDFACAFSLKESTIVGIVMLEGHEPETVSFDLDKIGAQIQVDGYNGK